MRKYVMPMCWALALDPASKYTQGWAKHLGLEGTYDAIQATWSGWVQNPETLKTLEIIALLCQMFQTPEWDYIQQWDDDEKITIQRNLKIAGC